LDDAQRERLIVNYLSRYGKGLTPEQVARIAHDPESRNTLVLRTLLDELICFGIHEKLDERIDYYLAAESIGDFFQRVLRRAEEDYGRELVRDTLALIAVSHDGMSESELLDMAHITPLHWSAFYCAFAAHFTVRNGRVNFSHRHMHDAAVARYLDAQSERAFRRRVIDYFTNSGEFTERTKESKHSLFRSVVTYFAKRTEAPTCEQKSEDNTRAWSELAHQYYCASMNKELHALVLRPEVFDYFYKKNIMRLVHIWQHLKTDVSGSFSLNDYLADERKNTDSNYYHNIGHFSELYFKDFNTAKNAYNKVIMLFRSSASTNPEAFNANNIAITLNNLGNLHYHLREYKSAENELLESLKIRRCLATMKPGVCDSGTAATLNNLGLLHFNLQDYTLAEKEFQEALEIYRCLAAENPEVFNERMAAMLNNLGALHDKLQNHELAEKEMQEALEIFCQIAEKHPDIFNDDVAMTLHNLAFLHSKTRNYELAEKEYRKALDIRRRLAANYPEAFDSEVAITLYNLGAMHYELLQDYRLAEVEI
ncbi:MAG: tetratricopeptide repeat protein, partial [Alistipes sp.]|nr:tetratricopeptide repeat protein [Alistipes sp.]